ncbi:MAG: nucleotide exchange factor GrpE [Candidatus Saccharibacteria bacterium]
MASPKNSKEDKQLAILQDKINELTEALQRERADAVNIRRRAEEDRLKMASYFKAVAVKDLLPFIDNFERGTISMLQKQKTRLKAEWLQGLVGVNKQLQQALDTLGV